MKVLSFSIAWAMPSRWTFEIPPIRKFVERHTTGASCIVDPFAGQSTLAHHRNDLGMGGKEAHVFLDDLLREGIRADVVIFDPPYSPHQISECYRGIGKKAHTRDTQNGRLYRVVRERLRDMLIDGGIALSFGWQSSGMTSKWDAEEVLLVQHGGAHNDTICVAQRKASGASLPLPSRDRPSPGILTRL